MNKFRSIYSRFFTVSRVEAKKFILIFYVVGTTGMLIPFTASLFKMLTPLALLVNFVVLTAFHQGKGNAKSLAVFITIFLLGYGIEVLGVQTHKIFGVYYYGEALGIKLFDTPLIIGLNWLFLCYVSNAVFEKVSIPNFLKVLFASGLMLIYDFVLEPLAPKLGMWYWDNNAIPLQNYLAWFIIAVFFNALIKVFKISTTNPLAMLIFATQFVFFLILSLVL